MKLASCDFCPTVKAKPRADCLTTAIDGRVYDICPDCRAKRDLQLQGKGVAAPSGDGIVRISWPDGTTPRDRTGTFYGVRPSPFVSGN